MHEPTKLTTQHCSNRKFPAAHTICAVIPRSRDAQIVILFFDKVDVV